MTFFNFSTLSALDSKSFLSRDPYPWVNPKGFLTEEAYEALRKDFPDMSLFKKDYGRARKFGQPPHNRFRLHFKGNEKKIPKVWQDFATALNGSEYRSFITRFTGVEKFDLRLEWHYTETGCFVSPHLDGYLNYGAHLFYFNTPDDWKAEWGGQTLILKSPVPLPLESNPDFSQFEASPAEALGNNSLFFLNAPNAWHGVKPLASPPGVYRKLFMVFIAKRPTLQARAKSFLKKIIKGEPAPLY